MAKKRSEGMVLDEDFCLFTETEEDLFDAAIYPVGDLREQKVSGLLDKIEAALKKARVRFDKQVVKQQRRDQKLKGGK